MKDEFPGEKRVHDIFFKSNDNTENVDNVEITVPEGYMVEAGSMPVSKTKEDWGNWGYYNVLLARRKTFFTESCG